MPASSSPCRGRSSKTRFAGSVPPWHATSRAGRSAPPPHDRAPRSRSGTDAQGAVFERHDVSDLQLATPTAIDVAVDGHLQRSAVLSPGSRPRGGRGRVAPGARGGAQRDRPPSRGERGTPRDRARGAAAHRRQAPEVSQPALRSGPQEEEGRGQDPPASERGGRDARGGRGPERRSRGPVDGEGGAGAGGGGAPGGSD